MTDTLHTVTDLAQRPWMSAILFGLLAVILGVAALARPGPSIVVAAVLFGAYVIQAVVAAVA